MQSFLIALAMFLVLGLGIGFVSVQAVSCVEQHCTYLPFVLQQSSGGPAAVEATPTVPAAPTAAPSAVPIATPTATPLPRIVVITDVQGSDPNDPLDTGYVLLTNSTAQALDLSGWTLSNRSRPELPTYTFPAFTLPGRSAVMVRTEVGVNDAESLYWGLDFPVWISGDTLVLRDNQGNERGWETVP